jgi:hypothetical protein
MFRTLAIAVITAVAALLETLANAIAATLPPPTVDSPRLRLVTPGRLCLRPRTVSPPPCQSRPRAERSERVLDAARAELARVRWESGPTETGEQ